MSARPPDGAGTAGGPPRPPAWRAVAYPLLAVAGLVVSLAGALVQALWFPGGLALALAATVALFYGGLWLTGTRLGAGLPLVGWFLMLTVLISPRPEGDFLFASGPSSYLYLFAGAVGGVICATLPPRRPSGGGGPPPHETRGPARET